MSTVRFARLNFERKLSHYSDQRSAIERRKASLLEVIDFSTDVNSLLRGTDMESKIETGSWYFGDVAEGEDYIAARLGKQTEETAREPNEDVEGFVEFEREDTIVSFFVIDLSTSVMAYEFRRDIGRKAPFRILEAAFNSYYDDEEEISPSPLVDKEEVREEIARLERITRVKFAGLTLPNPHSTDSSRSMHEFLRDSGIDRLLFDGESDGDVDDEGIDLEEEPLLDGGLNLAEEGYGSATIEGEDDEGEGKRVTTDEKPIETGVQMTDNDDSNRQRLVDEIRGAIERLDE